jgi:plasmid stabilization system protein ParE
MLPHGLVVRVSQVHIAAGLSIAPAQRFLERLRAELDVLSQQHALGAELCNMLPSLVCREKRRRDTHAHSSISIARLPTRPLHP